MVAALIVVALLVTTQRERLAAEPLLLLLILPGYPSAILIITLLLLFYKILAMGAGRLEVLLRHWLSRYRKQYCDFLLRTHHDMDVRGLPTRGSFTLSIDQVYVDLSLIPRSPHRATGHPTDDGATTGMADLRLFALDSGRQSVWDALMQAFPRPLAVIGSPGSGKTTLLKHVTRRICEEKIGPLSRHRGRSLVPILLLLREHAQTIIHDPEITICDLVRSTLSRLKGKEPHQWFERRLEKSQCLVMFDGLDEVAHPDHRRRIVEWVERQVAAYPQNYYILTSRPHGYRSHPLNSATVVQVLPFTHEQISKFVASWYLETTFRSTNRQDEGARANAEEDADDLLRRLRSNPALRTLSANPLLLTMIANVHYYRSALPGSRAELYRDICQVFLGKRQEAKGLARELTADQQEVVLRHLAYQMMCSKVRALSRLDASSVIEEVLAGVKRDLSPSDFLSSVEADSGLLLEQESGYFGFAHHTFQEYLAAAHIRERGFIHQLVPEIADPWWRETILLYVAQADADPIVASCLEYYAGNVDILALAADCAEEARQLSPDLRSQLEELLSSEAAQEDSVRRQLIAKTMLTRKLRRSVPLQGGGYLCGYAVTNAEYNFFLRDMALGGEFRVPDHQITHGLGDPSSPVTGLRSNDAIRFVMWTRSLGFNVRLPAHDELLGSDASDRTFNPSKQAAWVTKPGRRRLDSRLQVEVSASSSATLPLIPVEGRSMESSRRLIEGLQESVANREKRPPWAPETGLRTPPLAARRAVPDQTGSRPLSGGGLFVHYDATTLSLTNMGKSGRVLDAERVLTARICRDSVALVRAFMHGGDAGMRALAEEIQRMRGMDTPGWDMYKRFRADSVGHSRTSADERAKMAVQRVLAALQRIPRRDPSWLVRQDTPAVPSSLGDPSQIHETAALMTNKVDLDRLVESAFNGESEARAWLGQHSQHSEATMAWQVGRSVVAHALNLAFTREHASALGGLVLAGMRSLARIAIVDVIACLSVLEEPKHGAAFTQPLKQLYMGMLADLVVIESRIDGSLSATEVLLLVLE